MAHATEIFPMAASLIKDPNRLKLAESTDEAFNLNVIESMSKGLLAGPSCQCCCAWSVSRLDSFVENHQVVAEIPISVDRMNRLLLCFEKSHHQVEKLPCP